MSVTVKIGATLTGGSDVILSSNGLSANGKASFSAPTSSRLAPKSVDFLVKAAVPQGTNSGVARSGLKVAFASRVEGEGCCNPKTGTVILDLDFRWPLDQPEAVVDEVIAMIKGLVYTTAFSDAIKKGFLPS